MADINEISRLANDIGELRATARATDEKIDELREAMKGLTEAMTAVMRLDVEFKQHTLAMDAMRTRQDVFDGRLSAIEHDMPGLREARQWVLRAVALMASVVGVALLGLVIVKH